MKIFSKQADFAGIPGIIFLRNMKNKLFNSSQYIKIYSKILF